MQASILERLSRRILSSQTREQIIKTLKSMRQEYFVDEMHYDYYKKFIKPKLTLKESLKRRHGNLYIRYYVVLGKRYVGIEVIYLNEGLHERGRHAYVFIEDLVSGKLYVNKINSIVLDRCDRHNIVGNMFIYVCDDQNFRESLGFEYDKSLSEEILINHKGVYRVQGEIVLDVYEDDTLDKILYEFSSRNIVNSIYVERVAYLLIHAGLNVRINTRRNDIIIPGVIPRKMSVWDQANELCKAIKHVVKTITGLKEDGDKLVGSGFSLYIDCSVNRNSFSNYSYSDLIVNISAKDIHLEEMIKNDIREQVNKLTPQDIVLNIGRHHIELRNVIPTLLTYTPPERLYLGLIDPPTMTLDLRSFLVNSESEITIRHHEHGEVNVKFDPEYVTKRNVYVRIRTTSISSEYIAEQNRLVMKRILREIPKESDSSEDIEEDIEEDMEIEV